MSVEPARPDHRPEPPRSPETEEQRFRRLVAAGVLIAPSEPLAAGYDEILEPGPACPGAVQAVVESR